MAISMSSPVNSQRWRWVYEFSALWKRGDGVRKSDEHGSRTWSTQAPAQHAPAQSHLNTGPISKTPFKSEQIAICLNSWGDCSGGRVAGARHVSSPARRAKSNAQARVPPSDRPAHLRQARRLAHVVELEHGGAALGRAGLQLGGVDLDEALAQQGVPVDLRVPKALRGPGCQRVPAAGSSRSGWQGPRAAVRAAL